MSFNLGPFQRLTAFDVPPDDLLGPFWISSGELNTTGSTTINRRGAGVSGYLLGDGAETQWNLAFRNPADPQWIALGLLISTVQTSGGATSSTMEITFTGYFEDEERASDPPFNPNDIDWLDGTVLTIEGWGDTPALGGAELVRTFLSGGFDRTRFLWVEPTTTGIDLLPLSADASEAERYDITYPGSEDV